MDFSPWLSYSLFTIFWLFTLLPTSRVFFYSPIKVNHSMRSFIHMWTPFWCYLVTSHPYFMGEGFGFFWGIYFYDIILNAVNSILYLQITSTEHIMWVASMMNLIRQYVSQSIERFRFIICLKCLIRKSPSCYRTITLEGRGVHDRNAVKF